MRVWDGSPAVVTAYTHLLHVDTYFHEIAWSDVVDVGLAWLDVLGGSYIVLQFFRIAVVPLIVSVGSFFAVEIFYRVTQCIESDGVVGIDGQAFALFAQTQPTGIGMMTVLLRTHIREIHVVGGILVKAY